MNWKVFVMCITYNQSSYLHETLNGFSSQQTNFPFVCAIIDDASNDGTQDLITHYMNDHFSFDDDTTAFTQETDYARILFARHKENINCYFAAILLKFNHYSKKISYKKREYVKQWRDASEYMALCEGDDYWTLNNKLQLQVDFLDSHPDYSLCYGKTMRYIQSSHQFAGVMKTNPVHTVSQILYENPVQTLTALIRLSSYYSYIDAIHPETRGWRMGDYPMWIYLAFHSKIHLLPEVVGVYRVLQNSASHSSDINKELGFIDSVYEIKKFFVDKYNIKLEFDLSSLLLNEKFNVCFERCDDHRVAYYYHLISPKKPAHIVKYVFSKLHLVSLLKHLLLLVRK